jgi:acid phosphatase (class A)
MRALALAVALALSACASSPALHRAQPAPARAGGDPVAVVVLWLQRTRAPEEVERARRDAGLGLEAFAAALGGGFDAAAHPRTRALLERVHARATPFILSAKERFGRARPFQADRRVEPVAEREATPAYPSGHATRGALVARVLAELAPERREALRQAGLRPGYDRVMAGVHYPSDVLGGFRLGEALAELFLADPALRESIETVRREEWAGRN